MPGVTITIQPHQDPSGDVSDAIDAGGQEEQYKDVTRQLAPFRDDTDGRSLYDEMKDKRRSAATQRRDAMDRATRKLAR